ncbi:MAG: winged helix-turn-helix transcriptional regulator [Methanospirillum sp.]|nr:winged helix-turn-helix transcriptional regulator [Methanospirillum sp.]
MTTASTTCSTSSGRHHHDDRGTVSGLDLEFEKTGCIRREADPGDRRDVLAFVTDRGEGDPISVPWPVRSRGAPVAAVLDPGEVDGRRSSFARVASARAGKGNRDDRVR